MQETFYNCDEIYVDLNNACQFDCKNIKKYDMCQNSLLKNVKISKIA
jgi:hypothetical protein